MIEISTIVAGMKSVTSTFLGVVYKELAHATQIEKNTFKGSNKKYAVLTGSLDEVDGTVCHITFDQEFELILTDGYGGKALNDADKQTKTINLQQQIIDLYKEFKDTKAGAPSIVMHVVSLSMDDPEYLEEDHTVVIRSKVVIKYRKQL